MTLAKLVDDFLDKHEAALRAGRERDRVIKDLCTCKASDITEAFIDAHNKRAAAFRALQNARRKPK